MAMTNESLAAKLHPFERKVLPLLVKDNEFKALVDKSGLKDIEVMRALQWLQNKDLVQLKEDVNEVIVLDKNGEKYLKEGMPEKRFLNAIKGETSVDQVAKDAKLDKNEINICLGLLKRKAAIDIVNDKGLKVKITDAGKGFLEKESLEEKFLKSLKNGKSVSELKDEENFALVELKKRKSFVKVDVKKNVTADITKLGIEISKLKMDDKIIDTLTHDMLKNKSWKNKNFRAYDVSINVPEVSGGKRHFVNQTIEYVKQIWLDLGFKEMTGGLVQTSFWDLDALFVPQDHPARAMQDTFYIKDPKKGKLPEIWKEIKKVHENGGTTGSTGWRDKWSDEIAKELLLITHDTYLSAKVLANIKKEDLPVKTFQIMKVFRNENLDWKHLFEFYQVGGIVVGEDANFKHLVGYLKTFFGKMGYKDARIRPAHFPYVEPGAEIDVLHPIKGKWVELGGAGIFRPEVVKPLLGEEIPVLAWGFGLERIICPYFGINDLRHLYNNDLKQLKEMKAWMKL